jgi:hypothetical protein
MKQVILRWYQRPSGYAVLRDTDMPHTDDNYHASAHPNINRGLRAKIRRATNSAGCCPAAAAAVWSLRRTVALTAQGVATLRQVAHDYDPVGDPESRFC